MIRIQIFRICRLVKAMLKMYAYRKAYHIKLDILLRRKQNQGKQYQVGVRVCIALFL